MEALLLGGLGGVLPSTGGWVGGGVTHLGHSRAWRRLFLRRPVDTLGEAGGCLPMSHERCLICSVALAQEGLY